MTAEAKAARPEDIVEPSAWARRVALVVTHQSFTQNPYSDARCVQVDTPMLSVRALVNARPMWFAQEGRWIAVGLEYSAHEYLPLPAGGELVLDGYAPSAPNGTTRLERLTAAIPLDGGARSYRLTGQFGYRADETNGDPVYDLYAIDAQMECDWAQGFGSPR